MGGAVSGGRGGTTDLNRTSVYSPAITGGSGLGTTVYQPPAQQAAGSSYTDVLNSLIYGGMGLSGIGEAPAVSTGQQQKDILNTLLYNPGFSQAEQGILDVVSPTATSQGYKNLGYSDELANTGRNVLDYGERAASESFAALPYAYQTLSTAYDPQSRLYQRERAKEGDTATATNAMYGLSGTPYGAGVRNKALSDFDIDWQNQQLDRQLSGLKGLSTALDTTTKGAGAYSDAYGAYGTGLKTASGLGETALKDLYAGSTAPYSFYENYGTTGQDALKSYIDTANKQYYLPELTLTDLLDYLNLGQTASGLTGKGGTTTTTGSETKSADSSFLSDLTGFLGGAGLGSLAFGSGGLAGSLGIGAKGLLGELL